MSKILLLKVMPLEALLSDCEPNEAYASVAPGHAYAVYFPAGGGRVTLNTPGVKGRFILFRVDVDSGEWGPEQQVDIEDTMEMETLGNGNWAVAMIGRQ